MKQKLSLFILLSLLVIMLAPLRASAAVSAGITGQSIFDAPYLQSKGSLGVLVIPVQFSDVRFEDDAESNLEQVFRGGGTADAPSVKTYFANASYGSLYMDVIVQPIVTINAPRSDYDNDLEAMIVKCLDYVDDVREVNLNTFDENYDGCFDALYFVFAGETGENGSFWWPHTETYFGGLRAGGVKVGGCTLLSYEMLMNGTVLEQYTAIHETGHLLGLTDYYASGTTSGTNADVMMDRNKGDEDCFSKLLLGWTVPQTAMTSGTFRIESESVTSDALIVAAPDWDGNILSEYFMIEYVTPEANQSVHDIPEEGAIRIWHVNAGTSTFTNDITADMFRASNIEGSAKKLLQVIDPTIQWYAPGTVIEADSLRLVDGTETGIRISFDAIEDGEAVITLTYPGSQTGESESSEAGESSESSETSESSESSETSESEESSEIAESSEETEISESSETSEEASSEETESSSEASDASESEGFGEEETEERSSRFSITTGETSDVNMGNGDVAPRKLTVPVAIAIVLVFVLCFFLLRDPSGRRAHTKRRRKRRSR